MSKIGQGILVSLAALIAVSAAACGAAAPAVTATPEKTLLPSLTPTPGETALPTVTPTLLPYVPSLEGAVDIAGEHGGYKLRYQCFGEGAPAVVVEAGGGDTPVTSMTWKKVVQRAQSLTRICIYNRLDLPTSRAIAENLHTLLSKIPLAGPYILVAHSLGGFHARVFTHLYPKDVAGLILVDTTTTFEETMSVYAAAYPTYAPDEAPGVTRDRQILFSTPGPQTFGEVDLVASSEQVRQAGALGDLPLIVISENPRPLGMDAAQAGWAAGVFLQVQANLAKLSSKGVFRVAKTSDHFISLSEPQIIVDAIAQMVEEVRNP